MRDDFSRILREPQNSLIKQYQALLATEEVKVEFTDDAITELAKMCQRFNEETENIGARRLHTIMEYLLEDVSYEAPELEKGKKLLIDGAEVTRRLAGLIENRDLGKYIL